jgi:hypothetical protein
MFGGDGSVRAYLYVEDPVSDIYPNGQPVTSGLHFREGEWNTVLHHVVLNSTGNSDGEFDMWLNGVHVVNYPDVMFVSDPVPINLILCFWGYGSLDTVPATPNQWARFAAFEVLRTAP